MEYYGSDSHAKDDVISEKGRFTKTKCGIFRNANQSQPRFSSCPTCYQCANPPSLPTGGQRAGTIVR